MVIKRDTVSMIVREEEGWWWQRQRQRFARKDGRERESECE